MGRIFDRFKICAFRCSVDTELPSSLAGTVENLNTCGVNTITTAKAWPHAGFVVTHLGDAILDC